MAGMIVAESARVRCRGSVRELPQKLLLIHAVLESLPPVDEHDRHFVIELPPQFAVTIHIHIFPGEAAAALELRQALLHHLAQMATLAGVNHDLAGLRHAAIVTSAHPLLAREKETKPLHE